MAEAVWEVALLGEPVVRARPAWRAGCPGRAGRGRRMEEDTGSDVVGYAVPPGEVMIPLLWRSGPHGGGLGALLRNLIAGP